MSLGPSLMNISTRALPTSESLFPLGQGSSSWTTFPDIPQALPFSRSTLNPEKEITDLPLTFVNGPDNKESMKVHFPAGSYTLNSDPRGGVSFYSKGPTAFDLATAKEATFGYSVYFPEGFEWVKGGKLPGLYGGNSDAESVSCSGGRKDTTCFSSRLMWRANGAGELYSYLPPSTSAPEFQPNEALCAPPENRCDSVYGTSIGRGNFTFPSGQWTTVAQRVRLNDMGQANGEVEVWVDGRSVVSARGVVLRDASGTGRIRGLQVQSFFGGSTIEWAPKTDQDLYLADFSVAITERL